MCSFVYALNTMEERRILLENFMNHKDSTMFINKQWLVFGDFNEILDGEEHSGNDNNPAITSRMRYFQEITRYCFLSDMRSHRPLHTWCNKRKEGLICKKLERVLINDAVTDGLVSAYCVFELGGCSDHLRCRIQFEAYIQKKRKLFKLLMWLRQWRNSNQW